MTAQRFIQQVENLASLKDLVDLVKNPAAIIEAHETARQQLSLTQEVEAKLQEAKDFIKKHASLVMELDAAKASLEKDKKAFEDFANNLKGTLQQKESSLSEMSGSLKAKAEALVEKDLSLANLKKSIEDAQSAAEKNNKAVADKNSADASDNKKAKDANDSKANALSVLEASLKAKVAKLREHTADL